MIPENIIFLCPWHRRKEYRGVANAFLTSLTSPLFPLSFPTSEPMGRVCCLFSHTVLWQLETLNNCDIIKPNCERPLNRVYACVCAWCHSAARLPFISVWPQARKNTFWHQQLKASAHVSGTKVSLILFPSDPSLFLLRLCLRDCLLPVSIPTPFHRTERRVWLLQL